MAAPAVNRTYRVQAPLSRFVEFLWYYRSDAPTDPKELVLPAGRADIIVGLRSDVMSIPVGAGGGGGTFAYGVVAGPHTRPFAIDTSRPSEVIGISFRPGGALLLGVPARELADAHLAIDGIWRSRVAGLHEQLLAAGRVEERLRLLEAELIAQARGVPEPHPAVSFALRAFRGVPNPRTSDIAAQAGFSTRRLIELFKEQVGLTPKLYHRVRRFQRALPRIYGHKEVDWAEVASGVGYYDQAHFIHDFRRFSGLTPGEYLARRGKHFNHVPLPA